MMAIATAALAQPAGPAAADDAHPGKAIYDRACAACHDHPAASRAPSLDSLRAMRPSSVEYHTTVGYMRTQAKDLTVAERKQLEDWLLLGPADNGISRLQRSQCRGAAERIDPAAKPAVATWGVDPHNSRGAERGAIGPDQGRLRPAGAGLGGGPAADADHALPAGGGR